ncbi:hypothetical protein Q5Y75_22950 [Ruegeria sp. 2205SS24-7]|uniref:hypothetical protein n=1 Tax=Ruegeria discodermiae TaxID=3064389 RepID=UPI0027414450|nr:hypothetical protein [Ruegeria sp. 2205SS24-7]MDP5220067.1 hypothetical protein [Ruegeria sp. 2205SS24-7]
MERDQDILDYLQDRLGPSERETFEKTMARDASLAAEVAVMRAVRSELDASPKHAQAEAVWDRLSVEIDGTPRAANDNRQAWRHVLRYAAVALLAIAVWQFAVVPRIGEAPGGFRTASEQVDDFALQVKFVDGAPFGDISDLLGTLGGVISDGPSALGLVRVSFPDAAARAAALEAMREQVDFVEFVAE